MEFLIIIFLLFFSGLAYYRLEWAVLVLVAGLPAYLIRFDVLGLPGNLLEAMIGIAFLVWVFSRTNLPGFLKREYKLRDIKKNRQKRLTYPFGWEIILLLVIALVSVGVAGFKPDALGSWRAYFFEPALLFILVLNLFQTSKKRERIVWALAVSCLGLSVYAAIQKFTGIGIWHPETTQRATSVFPYPNALALYLSPLVLVLLGYFSVLTKRKDRILKIILVGVTIVLSVASVFWAKSEGGLIAIIGGVLLFLWLVGRRWRWFAYGVMIGVLGFLCFYPAPREVVIEKVTLQDRSGEIRKQQWQETWQMLQDGHFLAGSGLHNYQSAIVPYHQAGIFFNKNDDPDFRRKIMLFNEEYKKKFWQPVEIYLYPHNIFLNFWTELGLLGMLLFIWIIGKFITKGITVIYKGEEKRKYWSAGLVGFMAVIIIHGLVDVPYFKNDLAAMFWLVVALMSMTRLSYSVKNGQ